MRNRHQYRFSNWAITLIFVALSYICACTTDAGLTIEGGNPPSFTMSGRTSLESMKVSGPDKEREATRQGRTDDSVPYTKVYWEIAPYGEVANSSLSRLGPITYGVVPQ